MVQMFKLIVPTTHATPLHINGSIHIYIYTYSYINIHVYIYIYIYIHMLGQQVIEHLAYTLLYVASRVKQYEKRPTSFSAEDLAMTGGLLRLAQYLSHHRPSPIPLAPNSTRAFAPILTATQTSRCAQTGNQNS